MPTFTGTNGNDNLVGSAEADTFIPLFGSDTVDGLGGSDTLIVDYSHAPYDPYGGVSVPGDLISTVSANGGSLKGMINGGRGFVNLSHIEDPQGTFHFFLGRGA